MAAEKLMLQGRYFSRLRKYGMVGGTASLIGGVITYFVVKQRRANMENYFASMSPERQNEANDRCLKFQGVSNEKFPHVPVLDNSEGEFTGFFEKYQSVDFWLKAEKVALSSFDPELLEYYPELFLFGIRDDWYENEAKKVEAQKRLASARVKLVDYVQKALKKQKEQFKNLKKGDKKSKSSPEDLFKMLVVQELLSQIKEGIQNEDLGAPLAVKYLPKVQE